MTEILEAVDVVKRFGGLTAVDTLSFTVDHGTIHGLIGPNGAGKTTTLESLEGIRSPDSGTLRVADVDPTREPSKLHNLIGVQLQSAGLPESITPEEAMKFFCAYHQVAPRPDLLDRLGLSEKRKAQFYELSTGQQRRLALEHQSLHDSLTGLPNRACLLQELDEQLLAAAGDLGVEGVGYEVAVVPHPPQHQRQGAGDQQAVPQSEQGGAFVVIERNFRSQGFIGNHNGRPA